VPARGSSGGEGNGGGFLNEHDGAADFLKGLGNAGSDDFKKAKKELGLKYKAFEDEIKAYARELELPTAAPGALRSRASTTASPRRAPGWRRRSTPS
jgi:hypothetical protein